MTRFTSTLRIICIAAAAAAPALSQAYTFTVDGNGTAIKIWFTDGFGNRLGEPLFDGVLNAGESVSRTTNAAGVHDHSVVEQRANALAWNDVFYQGSSLAAVTGGPAVIPTLFDSDRSGAGISNIYYVVDVRAWNAGAGSFAPGQTYTGFSNGRHPQLPGFIVGYSSEPGLTIEQAFSTNTQTGVVEFRGAIPFGSRDGALGVSSRIVTNVPEPGAAGLLLGGLLALAWRQRWSTAKR